MLPTLIRSEVTSYNEMWPGEHRSTNWVNPSSLMIPERHEAFARVVHQEPVVAYYERNPASPPVRLSDFLSARQLRNSALYSEHYGPLGKIEDTLPVLWRAGKGGLNAIGLLRNKQFTDRDLALMRFLAPHLIQAHANSLALSRIERETSRLQNVLEASARALVVLKRDRTIEFATESARTWLREYFHASVSDNLPEPLDLWVCQHDSGVRQLIDLPKPRDPLVVNREDRRLVVRLLSGDEEVLLLLEEQKTIIEPAALRSLGLTRRESEVLAHMANGLNKVRIAERLGTSPRTIDAQVQKIMDSLGVSSSTAAAAKAFLAIRLESYPIQTKRDDAEVMGELNRRALRRG
ncbi:MAG: LuxR C-terminal-related transcriptional regulator [Candidatus Binataceae bacterium]